MFLSFSYIDKRFKNSKLYKKALLGALVITLIEFVFGVIFNIALKRKVWDYSDRPFNILGQVCPLFSVIWFLLSFIFIPFAAKISKCRKCSRSAEKRRLQRFLRVAAPQTVHTLVWANQHERREILA